VNKSYIGDGAYVEVDDATGNLVLTTEDGVNVTNKIVLEAETMLALDRYARDVWPETLMRLVGRRS